MSVADTAITGNWNHSSVNSGGGGGGGEWSFENGGSVKCSV